MLFGFFKAKTRPFCYPEVAPGARGAMRVQLKKAKLASSVLRASYDRHVLAPHKTPKLHQRPRTTTTQARDSQRNRPQQPDRCGPAGRTSSKYNTLTRPGAARAALRRRRPARRRPPRPRRGTGAAPGCCTALPPPFSSSTPPNASRGVDTNRVPAGISGGRGANGYTPGGGPGGGGGFFVGGGGPGGGFGLERSTTRVSSPRPELVYCALRAAIALLRRHSKQKGRGWARLRV